MSLITNQSGIIFICRTGCYPIWPKHEVVQLLPTVFNFVLVWIVLVTTVLIQPGTPPPCTDLRLFFSLGGGCAHLQRIQQLVVEVK
jgi:hypothetical protein